MRNSQGNLLLFPKLLHAVLSEALYLANFSSNQTGELALSLGKHSRVAQSKPALSFSVKGNKDTIDIDHSASAESSIELRDGTTTNRDVSILPAIKMAKLPETLEDFPAETEASPELPLKQANL